MNLRRHNKVAGRGNPQGEKVEGIAAGGGRGSFFPCFFHCIPAPESTAAAHKTKAPFSQDKTEDSVKQRKKLARQECGSQTAACCCRCRHTSTEQERKQDGWAVNVFRAHTQTEGTTQRPIENLSPWLAWTTSASWSITSNG